MSVHMSAKQIKAGHNDERRNQTKIYILNIKDRVRDGLVVMNTDCPSRGPGLLQHKSVHYL